MDAQQTQIVEINGVKLELDSRTATVSRIDTLRIGSKVKVLTKGYSSYKVRAGAVVGFDAFKNLPTITIAVLNTDYGSNPVEFISVNAESKDTEVLAIDSNEVAEIASADILASLDRNIEKAKGDLEEAIRKRDAFIKHFGMVFGVTSEPAAVAGDAEGFL